MNYVNTISIFLRSAKNNYTDKQAQKNRLSLKISGSEKRAMTGVAYS